MTDERRVFSNPLTDKRKGYALASYRHTNGTDHIFRSEVNEMTGDRLSGFDGRAPSINDSVSWVRSVLRDIRAKSLSCVIESEGIE